MKFSPKIFQIALSSILLSIALSSCGGGGGTVNGEPDDNNGQKKGVFLDSAVEGISYSSGALSGITASNGEFKYEAEGVVTFSLGSIVLGSAQGSAFITPLSLISDAIDETDNEVVNLLRFLQTLDNDADVTNGIQITQVMRDLIQGEVINFNQSVDAFANDGSIQTLIATLTSVSLTGARLLISEADALTHFQATLADLNGNGSGSGGISTTYCADNTPTLLTARGNVYEFDVSSGECLGILEDSSPKKTIPLSVVETKISDEITGIPDITIGHVMRIYLRTEGFNFASYVLNATFEITNNSNKNYCVSASNFTFKDSAGNALSNLLIYGATKTAELFINPRQRCLSPGYTHSYIAYGFNISVEEFNSIATIDVGLILIDPIDLSGIATLEKPAALEAVLSWKMSTDKIVNYPALKATFTNSLGVDIRLNDSNHGVWFFDEDGYVLSATSVRLHEALDLDEEFELVEDDYIISSGEVFSLLDDIADNAAVTPSHGVKAKIYLDWDYVTP